MLGGLKKAFERFAKTIAEKELTKKDLENACWTLTLELISSDVAPKVAEEIVEHIKRKLIGIRVKRFTSVKKILRDALKEYLENLLKTPALDLVELALERKKENQRRIKEGKAWIPLRLLFLGPNGHGKTTTIAKLAWMFKKRGFSVVLACSDTFRAGAIEQLETHAKRLKVAFIKRPYGSDPASVAYDAVAHASSKRKDVVLIDTAGRLGGNIDLMEEMRKIARVIKPDLKILVVDALGGNELAEQARLFNEQVGIDGSVLTKVDADPKGGAIITVLYATRKPIFYIGTGQKYDDLEPFNPEKYLSWIFG